MAKNKKEKKQMVEPTMDFIPLDGLGNIKEPGLIETEGIYPLIVKSATRKEKNNKKYIEVIIEVQGQEDSIQGIFNNLYGPMPEHDKKAKDFLMLLISRFCHAFEIPMDEGVNPGDFLGAQADLPVIKTSYPGKTGEVFKNEIVIPNLPTEE